ncbi:MAG: AmmeMemoRadiSam system protein B [Clostridiales bacterium]|nr:AmmeMemoRadiSam system protein B [Clostridiales bacterium]
MVRLSVRYPAAALALLLLLCAGGDAAGDAGRGSGDGAFARVGGDAYADPAAAGYGSKRSSDSAGSQGIAAESVGSPCPTGLWIDTESFLRREYMEDTLRAYEDGVYEAWTDASGITGEGRIRCLTLPHHLPGAGLSVFALRQIIARDGQPDTVILIGPNHENTGPAAALACVSWQTPYGAVEPDEEIVGMLLSRGLAADDPGVFAREHSMGMVIPWLARFMPGVKVVPLVFHYQYPLDKLEALFDALGPWLDEGALLVLSADFSHHQTRDEARWRDLETAALLEGGDWRSVAGLSSDYIDCPTLLAGMMRLAGARGWEGPWIAAHTNSGFLTGAAGPEVASYFVLAYTGE